MESEISTSDVAERGELIVTLRAGRSMWVHSCGRRLILTGGDRLPLPQIGTEKKICVASVGCGQVSTIVILCCEAWDSETEAEDLRMFRRALAEGKVKHTNSLLLAAGLAEAVTVSDPAGNEKLAKDAVKVGDDKRAKDDCVASSLLAVAEGIRRAPTMSTKPRLRYAVCVVSQ